MKARHNTKPEVALIVTPDGCCQCLHTEVIDLTELGQLDVLRATDIVFDNGTQEWVVKDTAGAEFYRNKSRELCLVWERGYISRREDEKHGGVI